MQVDDHVLLVVLGVRGVRPVVVVVRLAIVSESARDMKMKTWRVCARHKCAA